MPDDVEEIEMRHPWHSDLNEVNTTSKFKRYTENLDIQRNPSTISILPLPVKRKKGIKLVFIEVKWIKLVQTKQEIKPVNYVRILV